jgi:hypothetical protein
MVMRLLASSGKQKQQLQNLDVSSHHQYASRSSRSSSSDSSSDESDLDKDMTMTIPFCPLSESAARMSKKKRKLNADLWASTKEVIYHNKQHNVLDLEGTPSSTAAAMAWWYKDNTSGNIQGPLMSLLIQAWLQAGFFPPTAPF